MLNATPPNTYFQRKQKNKEIALANNLFWPPRRESNSQQKLRRFPLYPFNYREIFMFLKLFYDTKITKFIPIFIPI